MTDDAIIYTKHSVTFTGDATRIYSAYVLSSALKLYAETKIRPNRHVTLTDMLKAATIYTGKQYSRREVMLASQDLVEWANVARLSVAEEVK